MSGPRHWRITLAVTVVAAVIVLVVLAAAAWMNQRMQQQALAYGQEQAERYIRASEAALNRHLLALDLLLAGIDESLDLARDGPQSVDKAKLTRLLRQATGQNLLVRDLLILDREGRLVAFVHPSSERWPPQLPGPFLDAVNRQPFPALALSEPMQSPVTTETVIHLARPLRSTLLGPLIAVAEVQMPLLEVVLTQANPPEGATVTLERGDARLITRLPHREGAPRPAPALDVAHAHGDATRIPGRTEAGMAVHAARPTLYADVFIAVEVPEQHLLARWAAERRALFVVTAAFIAFIVAVAALTRGQWQRLASAREALRGFNQSLERQVAERTAALVEREALLRVVTDNVPVMMAYRDAQSRLLYANQRYAQSLGRPDVGSVLGRTLAELMPEWAHAWHRPYSQRANAGQSVRYEAPRITDPSRTLEVMLEPDFDANGQVQGVFAAALDITERKRAQAELARAHADLRRFAEVAAHHLMEPARRLRSYVQRLRNTLQAQGTASDDNVAASLFVIEREARRQAQLVHDVQRYLAAAETREAGAEQDTAALAADLRNRWQQRLADEGVSLEIGELPRVTMPREQLIELFELLVDNAIEHAHPSDGPRRVHISGERVGNLCRLRVSDNGQGIAEAFRERVFDIFERLGLGGSGVGEVGGTGIGLAIARRIVESRHGRIWIEASSMGGTAVAFEIPDPS